MEINIAKLKEYAAGCGVLYVEDDELIRTQTVEFLGRFFPHIDIATNGVEGLEKYDSLRHNIVISDINMPKMNGIDMIEAIRKKDEQQIVLVTSAHNDSENLMRLIDLGINRFVLKPFNFKQFIIMLYYIAEDIYIRSQNIIMKEMSQKIVDLMESGIILFRDSKISMANRAFLRMGGFKTFETLLLEMPEIGVMFQPCTDCLSGTTNHEFLTSLQTLPPSHHKVRIESGGYFREYQVQYSDIGDLDIVVVFTDITAIHDELSLDIHTSLPCQRVLLEEMEIMGDQKAIFYTLLVTIRNYDALVKYYRKSDAIGVEKEASQMLKDTVKKMNEGHFIGYFGTNQFVLVSSDPFDKKMIGEIESGIIHYINNLGYTREGADFHLSYKTKSVNFKAKIPIPEMVEALSNEFDLI